MTLDDIKEVRECETAPEVNKLLGQGNWKLLDVMVGKLTVPDGKKQVGQSFTMFHHSEKYEVVYAEKMSALYIVGRYK